MKIAAHNILVARCGMNCGLCYAYLRKKNKCSGCRGADSDKTITRLNCTLKNCGKSDSEFCFDCEEFPCKRLKNLDKRYRLKYHMSMIENLINLKKAGIDRFVENEKEKWTCPGS